MNSVKTIGDQAPAAGQTPHLASERSKYDQRYWAERFDLIYYQSVDYIVRSVGKKSKNLLDVGTGNCPYLEWFDWIEKKTSIDIIAPYKSANVKAIKGNIVDYDFQEKFDLCLCLQVLEHVPDAGRFAQRLLTLADTLIVSVPYEWPEGKTEGHVHDPVDLEKLQIWFERAPNYTMIVQEPLRSTKSRRLIAIFDADQDRRFGAGDIQNRVPKLATGTTRVGEARP